MSQTRGNLCRCDQRARRTPLDVAARKSERDTSDGVVGLAGVNQHAITDLILEVCHSSIAGRVVQLERAVAVHVVCSAGIGGAVALGERAGTGDFERIDRVNRGVSSVAPRKRLAGVAAQLDMVLDAIFIGVGSVEPIRKIGGDGNCGSQGEKSGGAEETNELHDGDASEGLLESLKSEDEM
jgi:hypothetical protein